MLTLIHTIVPDLFKYAIKVSTVKCRVLIEQNGASPFESPTCIMAAVRMKVGQCCVSRMCAGLQPH